MMYHALHSLVIPNSRLSRNLQSVLLSHAFFSASNILEQAQQLSKSYQNTVATTVDVTSEEHLGGLIRDHELVVRSVPKTLLLVIACYQYTVTARGGWTGSNCHRSIIIDCKLRFQLLKSHRMLGFFH